MRKVCLIVASGIPDNPKKTMGQAMGLPGLEIEQAISAKG